MHKAFVAAAGGEHAKANPEITEQIAGLKLSRMEESGSPEIEKYVRARSATTVLQ